MSSSMHARFLVPLCLLVALQPIGGCGGDEEPEPPTRPVERADPPPRLPRGWAIETNRAAGFTVGVPPGWGAKSNPARTVLRAPRGAAVISITADRTDEALELPLIEYATQVAEGLAEQGYEKLKVGRATARRGHYDGAAVAATGVRSASGARQRFDVIILRRPKLAAYPVLVASHRATPLGPARPLIDRIVNSLRGRPVAGPD